MKDSVGMVGCIWLVKFRLGSGLNYLSSPQEKIIVIFQVAVVDHVLVVVGYVVVVHEASNCLFRLSQLFSFDTLSLLMLQSTFGTYFAPIDCGVNAIFWHLSRVLNF